MTSLNTEFIKGSGLLNVDEKEKNSSKDHTSSENSSQFKNVESTQDLQSDPSEEIEEEISSGVSCVSNLYYYYYYYYY